MTNGSLWRRVPGAGLILLASGLLPAVAVAGEALARLTVELEVSGREQSVNVAGRDHAEGTFHDTYRFSATLRTSGALSSVNTKDPDYSRKMLARSAAVQARVRRAQGEPEVPTLTAEELEARALAGQEACAGDMTCLMELSQELSEQLMALQAQQAAPGSAAAGDPVGNPETWEEEEEEDRYLHYYPYDGCASEYRVTINRRISGEYADVQGMVPYSVTRTGDESGDANVRRSLCLRGDLVLDVTAQALYSDGIGVPDAMATTVRQVRGRPTETSQSRMGVQSDIGEWLVGQLRTAPVSGRREATIQLRQDQSGALSTGNYSGTADVVLSWRLERL